MALLPAGHSDLHQRFLLLTGNQQKHKHAVNIVLFLVGICIYLFSYAFIPEAYCSTDFLVPQDASDESNIATLSTDNTYLIDNEDGTYDVYLNGKFLDTTDTPEYYPADAPVYTKETCPY
jgi:hypothetical protein